MLIYDHHCVALFSTKLLTVSLWSLDGGHASRLCPCGSAHESSGGVHPGPHTGGDKSLHQDRSVHVLRSAAVFIDTETSVMLNKTWLLFIHHLPDVPCDKPDAGYNSGMVTKLCGYSQEIYFIVIVTSVVNCLALTKIMFI